MDRRSFPQSATLAATTAGNLSGRRVSGKRKTELLETGVSFTATLRNRCAFARSHLIFIFSRNTTRRGVGRQASWLRAIIRHFPEQTP